jgi:hypothetical protein
VAKLAEFPKAGRLAHNFFHKPSGLEIPDESRSELSEPAVNLSVTKVLKLTGINFLAIHGIYSQRCSRIIQPTSVQVPATVCDFN